MQPLSAPLPREEQSHASFLAELTHKIWITKGARFNASARLLARHELSNKAIGFLSAYLIIMGLLSVYRIYSHREGFDNLLAFGSTTLSILLLVFTQLEAAQDYKMKAHLFHDCALRLSKLYHKIRWFETMQHPGEEEKSKFCAQLAAQYQAILDHYTNHEDIDYQKFQLSKKAYFKLNAWQTLSIWWRYYLQPNLFYWLVISLPPLVFVGFIWW